MRTIHSCRLLALVAGLLLVGGVAAQPHGELGEILRHAAEREQDIPHEGLLTTTVRGMGRERHSFRRRIYAGHRACEVSEPQNAGPFADQRVVCDGRQRWRVLHSGSVVLVTSPFDFEQIRRDRVERAKRALEGMIVRRLADQTIAGRPAWTIEIARRNREGREVRVRALAIDKETSLQLGNVTYDREGSEISRTAYDEVEYLSDEEIDDRRFIFIAEPGALVLPEPSRIELPVLFRDARARAPWITPLRNRPRHWRPEGVALPDYAGQCVAQFYYVDERDGGRGRPVFLFEHPRAESHPFFDGYYNLHGLGRDPRPYGQSVAWSDEALVYVLTSAIPIEDLLSAARNHLGR